MTRRVITAREQHEMLSPWREAATEDDLPPNQWSQERRDSHEREYMKKLEQERLDRRGNATKIYRGLRLDLPSELEDFVHEHYRKDVPYNFDEIGGHLVIGPKLLDHLQKSHPNLLNHGNGYGFDGDDRLGLGRHWTVHRQFAEKAAMQGGRGKHQIVIEADRPGPEHRDPKRTGVGDWSSEGESWKEEEEDTLLPGTPLNVTGVKLNGKEVLHNPRLEERMPKDYDVPLVYPGGPRQHTAALSEEEGQHLRRTYQDSAPGSPNLPESLKPHLMLPVAVAHHYREYDRPHDDVLGQVIAEQGIRQPLRISTDGTHATLHEGNHRLEVAKRLGLTHVPVQVTLEKPGDIIHNGGRPPVPLEPHLGDWIAQNIHQLKSFWS